MAKMRRPDWQNIFDEIFQATPNILEDIYKGVEDVMQTWLKKDAVTNTPLHIQERSRKDGTKDPIK